MEKGCSRGGSCFGSSLTVFVVGVVLDGTCCGSGCMCRKGWIIATATGVGDWESRRIVSQGIFVRRWRAPLVGILMLATKFFVARSCSSLMLLIMTVDVVVVVAVGVGGSEGERTESCLGRMDRDASLIRTNRDCRNQ